MKGRESGMPEEALWRTFFDPPHILKRLGLNARTRDVAELGCGYGTFTIPAAGVVSGTVYALDIEREMLDATQRRAEAEGVVNVRPIHRDFIADGTGLPDASVDFVLLFNILHIEEPVQLLREAARILVPAGRVGILHWNHDPTTPRGPSMAIRPRPEQCIGWARAAGFRFSHEPILRFPPYHYGMTGIKRTDREVPDFPP